MKVVLNKCYGGFGISEEAKKWMIDKYGGYSYERNSSVLIDCVETLGSKMASGDYADLQVIEIPDDVNWEIEDYDGIEWVSEVHRTWG